jgi:hypothetical protein
MQSIIRNIERKSEFSREIGLAEVGPAGYSKTC